MADLDPNDHCDRHTEQEQFADMVREQSAQRLLIISDVSGSGKSSLLRKLQYNCSYKIKDIEAGVPSSLIELKSLKQPEPFDFIRLLVERFNVRGQKSHGLFTGFNKLVSALDSRDSASFDDGGQAQPQGLSAGASINTTVMQGGSIIGVSIKGDNVVYNEALPVRPEFTPDQLARAKERCVEAFFEDLTAICAHRPAVILLDTWEGCIEELRAWIFGTMLGDKVFHRDLEKRPKHLTVVIAGQPRSQAMMTGLKVSDFLDLFDTEEEFREAVHPIDKLGTDWGDDIVKFMRSNGYEGKALPEEDVELLKRKIAKRMWPPQTAAGWAQQLAQAAPLAGAS